LPLSFQGEYAENGRRVKAGFAYSSFPEYVIESAIVQANSSVTLAFIQE
jgi:hypothetical protein